MHQAVKPHLAIGAMMGWLVEQGDAAQVRATVEAFEPPRGAATLEIGFGGGDALEALARTRPLGLIAGIEASEVAVCAARRRLDGGRGDAGLDLRAGEPFPLPFPDEHFDLVYSINGFQEWPDAVAVLAEMTGVLKPGGDLVLSIRDLRADGGEEPAHVGAKFAQEAAEALRELALGVRVREIVHSSKRATFLVRGRKCGRAN
jgi:ubiquinone/menaquinone biosynthesis C-methylase UbiE